MYLLPSPNYVRQRGNHSERNTNTGQHIQGFARPEFRFAHCARLTQVSRVQFSKIQKPANHRDGGEYSCEYLLLPLQRAPKTSE
jgi:hypothetical protein